MYCSILCDFFLLHGRRLLPFHSYFCSQRKFVHFVSISIFLLISILQCVQLCCSNWFVIDGVVGVVVYMGGGEGWWKLLPVFASFIHWNSKFCIEWKWLAVFIGSYYGFASLFNIFVSFTFFCYWFYCSDLLWTGLFVMLFL